MNTKNLKNIIFLICIGIKSTDFQAFASQQFESEVEHVCFENEDCWNHIKSMMGIGTHIPIGEKFCPLNELQLCSDEIDKLGSYQITRLFSIIYKRESEISSQQFHQTDNFQTKNYVLNLFYMSYLLDAIEKSVSDAFKAYSGKHLNRNFFQFVHPKFTFGWPTIEDQQSKFLTGIPTGAFDLLRASSRVGATHYSLKDIKTTIYQNSIQPIRVRLDEYAQALLEERYELDPDITIEEQMELVFNYIDLEIRRYVIKNFHDWWANFYSDGIALTEDLAPKIDSLLQGNWDSKKARSEFTNIVWNRLEELKLSKN